MKSITVAEFERDLPAILRKVAGGESIVLQNKSRENLVVIAPTNNTPAATRKLGVFSDRGKVVFKNWEMTEEDFFGAR